MRTIWKGYLKIRLVSIPVKMYNATTRGKSVSFNLLHEKCSTRIRQEKVCPKCGKTLDNDEIVRGYQYGKDMYVIVEEEDIEKAKKESTDFIDVIRFVADDQIKPIYYDASHYLIPDGKVGEESFALFQEAMERKKKSALGRVVIREKEHLLCIKPYDGVMIAHTLHYADEVQDVNVLDEKAGFDKGEVKKENLELALSIVDNLSGEFRPEEFVDEYAETLQEIIKAKAEGKEVTIAPKVEKGKVINLMEALKKSVEETEKTPKKDMARSGKSRSKTEKKRKKG